ncbi:hypothetical protein K8I61_01275 [bacterium]|nr:hypothetical protein [bacterium]
MKIFPFLWDEDRAVRLLVLFVTVLGIFLLAGCGSAEDGVGRPAYDLGGCDGNIPDTERDPSTDPVDIPRGDDDASDDDASDDDFADDDVSDDDASDDDASDDDASDDDASDDDASDDDFADDDASDDDASDDDVSDDDFADDDFADDDASDDDAADDDDDPPLFDSTPSFNLGLVHFQYYFGLGGYNGQIFYDDHEWMAENIEFAIIYYGDLGMDLSWEELKANNPRGSWLKWRLAQLLLTNESGGSCSSPSKGAADQDFNNQMNEFNRFLGEYPQYGDGESCFLHARNDGRVEARWHVMGCDVTLNQAGYSGSAGGNMKNARMQSLIWDEYAWLFDVSSDCAKDYVAWRTIKDIQEEHYGGEGFDNIGGPLNDMYYLPDQIDQVDIMEIPNSVEYNASALETWWRNSIDDMMEYVNARTQNAVPGARILYNGASYCSWDGSVDWLKGARGENLGVWCEDALHYPSWGNFDTPDRFRALLDLSNTLAADGGYIALETFYNGGHTDPTPVEVMYYLSAIYVLQGPKDVYVIKPTWLQYNPIKDLAWFDIFGRDIGTPTGPGVEGSNGVFSRNYLRSNGQRTKVVVRVDGDRAPISYNLGGTYCSVDVNNNLTTVSGSVSLPTGGGLVLIEKGTGDCP